MRPHRLYADAIETLGVDAVATALGIGRSHAYRLARHPADVEDPDGTGARSDVERVRTLMVTAAGMGEFELVVRWRAEFDAMWRWLLRTQCGALTIARLRSKGPKLLRELADLLEAIGKDEADRDEIRRETLDVRALCDRILLATEQPFAEDDDDA